MSQIHVSPISKVEATIATTSSRHLVTLLSEGTAFERPAAISAQNHPFLRMHDIVEAADGMMLPGRRQVASILDFARRWDASTPLVVNCYAGISRSTATAYMIVAALRPDRDEAEIAATLRRASPSATPNLRLISIADELLGRSGRMTKAIVSIGRGADAFEGTPFALPLDR